MGRMCHDRPPNTAFEMPRGRMKMHARTRSLILGVLVAAAAVAVLGREPERAHAAAVVTTCTETSFNAAIASLGSLGGTVTFACSGTITLTSTRTISPPTELTIDGAGQAVTISGGGTLRQFLLNAGAL